MHAYKKQSCDCESDATHDTLSNSIFLGFAVGDPCAFRHGAKATLWLCDNPANYVWWR